MDRLVILVISLAVMASVMPAYGQEAMPEQAEVVNNTVSGEVVSVDLEKSALTLQTTDMATGAKKNEDIQLMSGTGILSGNVSLGLSDLKVGDEVEVEYSVDETGNLQASIITVK